MVAVDVWRILAEMRMKELHVSLGSKHWETSRWKPGSQAATAASGNRANRVRADPPKPPEMSKSNELILGLSSTRSSSKARPARAALAGQKIGVILLKSGNFLPKFGDFLAKFDDLLARHDDSSRSLVPIADWVIAPVSNKLTRWPQPGLLNCVSDVTVPRCQVQGQGFVIAESFGLVLSLIMLKLCQLLMNSARGEEVVRETKILFQLSN